MIISVFYCLVISYCFESLQYRSLADESSAQKLIYLLNLMLLTQFALYLLVLWNFHTLLSFILMTKSRVCCPSPVTTPEQSLCLALSTKLVYWLPLIFSPVPKKGKSSQTDLQNVRRSHCWSLLSRTTTDL